MNITPGPVGPRLLLRSVAYSAPAEMCILLAAARTNLRNEDAQRVRALAADQPDWDALMRLATRHQVTPLLFRSLYSACPELVPPDVLDKLRGSYTAAALHNMFMTSELVSLMQTLEAKGIPAATIKGPSLALTAYGDPGLRLFSDLDILIHKTDFARARAVLADCGYQPALDLTPEEERAHLRVHHDYPLEHAHKSVVVELQWGIMESPFRFPRDLDQWWGRFQYQPIAGKQVMSMPAEDMLHILCVHGCKHLWERLSWICDLNEMICAHPQLDWEALAVYAQRLGSRRMVRVGLLLTHLLLETRLPSQVVDDLGSDHVALQLAARSCVRLFNPQSLELNLEEEAPLYYLRMHERWRDRARIALHFYPSLLRPLRVLRKYRIELLSSILEK